MLDEVTKVEAAEASIDSFIERRAKGAEQANEAAALEHLQTESRAQRYRRAVLYQRLQFHEEQIHRHTATFERLIKRHCVGLRLVEEALGITNNEGPRERKSA